MRGFAQGKRTWLYELRYHRWDYIVLGFSALLAIGGLVASYVFHMGDFIVPQFFYKLFA
jgi:energy-coupling factor transporter transmembrane protein EcfT